MKKKRFLNRIKTKEDAKWEAAINILAHKKGKKHAYTVKMMRRGRSY